MKIATGHVVDGKLLVEGRALPDGAVVTILEPEDAAEEVTLSQGQEDELLEAARQIRDGKWISGAELLEGLKSRS